MKIHHKLFLILFCFSFFLVTGLVLLMQWSIGKGMIDYVNTKEIEQLTPLVERLSNDYQHNENWHFIAGQDRKFHQLIMAYSQGSDFFKREPRPHKKHKPFNDHHEQAHNFSEHKRPKHRPPKHLPPKHLPPEHGGQYAILDHDESLVVGRYKDNIAYSKLAIKHDDKLIGYFVIAKRNELTQGYEVDFVEQQQHYLWVIAVLTMLLVAMTTLPLTRHIVRPLKKIAFGVNQLTQGNFQESVDITRSDELGELVRDYNELALTLSENEHARKRWLADISHELRTPVAILRGELEAMIDKVRPLTFENIASANDEVKHLQQLIDDLNLLTSADVGGMRYCKKNENLSHLIQRELDKYRRYLADAGIELQFNLSEQSIITYSDKTRILQLCENLINNCIKYSSASLLLISLRVEYDGKFSIAELTFEDDGVGVDDKHLPYLFEHLYRVDDSRNRNLGGSGLGLAICRQIVDAHHGEIYAENSRLGGLAIMVKLPIVNV